ncbi:MAG: T9SS type A sorting domain-containing protein, partial [Paludibacteraceae bacterium]|nr:T9SS type A sorting domain-containing protein [Paludibacteraceae bacterium]
PEGLEPNTQNNPDDIFLVAVSPDNGTTWDEQNSFIWKANDNVRNLNTFSATMQNVRIDLSAYVGKQVKIAFYAGGSSENTSNNWLYLDNVQLNRYSINEYNAQSCQYADYEDELFSIRAEAVVPGTYQYEKFVTAQTDGQNDIINRMTLNVTAAETVDYYAQTCAGNHYEGHDFVIDDAQTAVYKSKFTSVNGCDSIVNLYLTANIVSHGTVIDTICQGGSYVWNGKTFQTATVLTDTLTSTAGCDSIVTLVLSVREAIRTTEDKFLCYGNTLQLGNLLITEGGQYTATLPSADNCDSIVTWNVIAVPELHSTKRAMICTGSSYDDGQFVGLTREVTVSATDISLVSGCDSIVTLKLFVANAGETRHDTIAPADLPYVLNGTELLPAGTANGTYENTVSLPCGNVTLFITVGSSTGLHDAWGSNVRIAPNPVSVNEPIRITGLTAGRQTISIYDAVGRLALRTLNDAADCTINGLDEAGIYMIQITDAQGMTYHAKLVVK